MPKFAEAIKHPMVQTTFMGHVLNQLAVNNTTKTSSLRPIPTSRSTIAP
jgi:hypothetical protein